MNPVHIFPYYFFNIHSNIILLSTPMSSTDTVHHMHTLFEHLTGGRMETRSRATPALGKQATRNGKVHTVRISLLAS